ncbi:TetR family transcriptional regulator [Frankia sp. AgB1.9]|uniref:TetR/AcrR family transcriptional regulator n=1 Tax=unclassified Frankia TaxID=2632575 RepID=UPI0019312EB1|nr:MULTISPECIES: TetR/AcrR family transcriptional regulator [unclassified Frankia]MBL7486898.1 TetR family transcriptional regulator [Frankia sp. AgW1.1]MBL7547215.1 TetR family transcriptional regulator [Frankia sp. AgB1.9]MBL7623993.1 TetR family transcriptional regulator [Frankia sp. AgB1.8]
MAGRRDDLLDAAIDLLGEQGVRALTHRAVDAAAGLSAGSTSNYFRTREALFDAIVERFAARERANWEELAARLEPRTTTDLARALAVFARDSAGRDRALTLSRYAILVEASRRPELRAQLGATGARVNTWFVTWLRLVGSTDPDHHVHVVGNYLTGLVLHQLAIPDPDFDPTAHLDALLASLIQHQPERGSRDTGS